MFQVAYRVTRLPGAPPRRAGLVWEEGDRLVFDLTAEQVRTLVADPGYRIEATYPSVLSGEPVPLAPEAGARPRRRKAAP